MRILHIIDSGGLYGAEMVLLSLMEEQERMGLAPVLASIGEQEEAEKPLEAEARRRGLSVREFRMKAGPNLAGAQAILLFARQEGMDLIHSHGYKGNILFGFMPVRLRRLPLVSTIHGWTWTGGASRMMLYEWLDGVSLRFADRVVVVNEAMVEHPRIKKLEAHLSVVENGVPVENSVAERFGGPLDSAIVSFCGGGFVIGAIGRLSREKGFDVLIDATFSLMSTRDDVRLVILGEGGLRPALEAKIGSLGIADRVLMPGYVADARNYLGLFSILAMPSLTEGLPMVLLEAMQAGVPVVASAVGGIPRVLDRGRAGTLVPPGNAAALAAALIDTVTNQHRAKEKAAVAMDLVRVEYSSRRMAEKYLSIYHEVLPESLPRVTTGEG
ncbi:glycosyltransferase [Geobacter pickeringii]|uniref:glycosyltransferase n=1 Tax=Geobacter pickeringii TaxID=345632 RepID=UPI000690C0BF|nr:glycosyltransferase [Geobacter pickeringii]